MSYKPLFQAIQREGQAIFANPVGLGEAQRLKFEQAFSIMEVQHWREAEEAICGTCTYCEVSAYRLHEIVAFPLNYYQ